MRPRQVIEIKKMCLELQSVLIELRFRAAQSPQYDQLFRYLNEFGAIDNLESALDRVRFPPDLT